MCAAGCNATCFTQWRSECVDAFEVVAHDGFAHVTVDRTTPWGAALRVIRVAVTGCAREDGGCDENRMEFTSVKND